MLDNRVISFLDLRNSDLIIDALYEGGNRKHAGDDPISKLLGCGNQGGFRYKGSVQQPGSIQLCVLYSELSDPDWPDSLDTESGLFFILEIINDLGMKSTIRGKRGMRSYA